jgi:histidine ammonia-lyase
MIELTGQSLTIEDLVAVGRHGVRVAPLDQAVQARMQRVHTWVEESIQQRDEAIYGVNTGFGSLATQRIAPEEARKLSRNVILACVSGVGPPLPAEIVRGMMLIRANVFAKGYSGVRPVVAQTLVEMLNAGVTPFVPCKGSLGASGDLAPSAHVAVVMTRDVEDGDGGYSGQAWLDDQLMRGTEAMARAGIERLVPEVKEGLSLTNTTDFMVAAGALATHDAENLLLHAEIAAGLSLEALLGVSEAFDPALHAASGQPGQAKTAAEMRTLIEGSQLVDSMPERVQDAYSLRCIPQVLGPGRDVLTFLCERFAIALNAATDNPLIFPDDAQGVSHKATSGGNFHGQGPAIWLDMLGIALAEVGNISERRVFRLLTPELSSGLPSMLAPTSGLDSGLMMPQYTAAALVSDNKTLAHPDSVDSIPSCANQEDYVSMGANAARHALEILDNVRHIIAIELLCAVQAIDLRPNGPTRLGRGTAVAYARIREQVAFLDHDRELTPDIEALVELIRSNQLVEIVRDTTGAFPS